MKKIVRSRVYLNGVNISEDVCAIGVETDVSVNAGMPYALVKVAVIAIETEGDEEDSDYGPVIKYYLGHGGGPFRG